MTDEELEPRRLLEIFARAGSGALPAERLDGSVRFTTC